MSQRKKEVRRIFHDAVCSAASWKCSVCKTGGVELDAHHIVFRKSLPQAEQYDPKHGIALCDSCHWEAEACLQGTSNDPKFMPDNLRAIREAQ